jgi:hypothetical protein
MGPEQVDTVYDYAKTIYECGDYPAARELLDQYATYSTDANKILSSIWGKLACEILTSDVRLPCTAPAGPPSNLLVLRRTSLSFFCHGFALPPKLCRPGAYVGVRYT